MRDQKRYKYVPTVRDVFCLWIFQTHNLWCIFDERILIILTLHNVYLMWWFTLNRHLCTNSCHGVIWFNCTLFCLGYFLCFIYYILFIRFPHLYSFTIWIRSGVFKCRNFSTKSVWLPHLVQFLIPSNRSCSVTSILCFVQQLFLTVVVHDIATITSHCCEKTMQKWL